MNGWLAFEYYPSGYPGPVSKIALPVLATHIQGTEDVYGVMPAGEFPEGYKPSMKDGVLRDWPRVERLGGKLFANEHEVYSLYMRTYGHRQGEMESALHHYAQERERWRRRWMQAMHATEADADREERRW
jgi:hypothetical protein